MSYIKDDLYNTNLPTLIIKKNNNYNKIGLGAEGTVYKYNDQLALKFFNFFKDRNSYMKKFKKIELLSKLKDPNACFPIGLVGYEDEKKEGYFHDLVDTTNGYKNFELLNFLNDLKQILEFVIDADLAIQRFHKMGIILGDIKGDNIMINNNNSVKFIDTDNWMYNGYEFDLIPGRATWLSDTFKKEFSPIDNDKFVFAIMAIQYFVDGSIIRLHKSDNYFKNLIKFMNVSKDVKDGLRLIFSDAKDKPYIGPILKEINPHEKILSKEAIYKINRSF